MMVQKLFLIEMVNASKHYRGRAQPHGSGLSGQRLYTGKLLRWKFRNLETEPTLQSIQHTE